MICTQLGKIPLQNPCLESPNLSPFGWIHSLSIEGVNDSDAMVGPPPSPTTTLLGMLNILNPLNLKVLKLQYANEIIVPFTCCPYSVPTVSLQYPYNIPTSSYSALKSNIPLKLNSVITPP